MEKRPVETLTQRMHHIEKEMIQLEEEQRQGMHVGDLLDDLKLQTLCYAFGIGVAAAGAE